MIDNYDRFLYWIAFPTILWCGFGINSLIVYFAQIGGPVPLWMGVWGIACTVGCAAAITYGIRSMRRGANDA